MCVSSLAQPRFLEMWPGTFLSPKWHKTSMTCRYIFTIAIQDEPILKLGSNSYKFGGHITCKLWKNGLIARHYIASVMFFCAGHTVRDSRIVTRAEKHHHTNDIMTSDYPVFP